MSLETLKENHKHILNCKVQDDSGLNDFQKIPNDVHIAIPRVGIERFRIPLRLKHPDGQIMSHDMEASMFVFLEAEKTGVNMSRFCAILQEEGEKHTVDEEFFKNILDRFTVDLRDYHHEKNIPEAEFKVSFRYPVKQKSLKSDNWGWQYYQCEMKATRMGDESTLMGLTIAYEYSSTCPCSLSMSKQYEKDFREGLIQEGNGIATAHSQRSIATCSVTYNIESDFGIEKLIKLLREALPTETQSLVKRADEQAFAILNGEHPMFVEHAARRISVVFDNEKAILDWNAKIEHLESLHSHNAVAYISKQHS